jgi:hypothetical protein
MRKSIGFVCVALLTIGLGKAGHAADQGPEIVVIGCLERTGPQTYVIKDHRSGAPFRVRGDNRSPERSLGWQVGHVLEIHGAIDPLATPAQKRLVAETVIELSPACPGPSPDKSQ